MLVLKIRVASIICLDCFNLYVCMYECIKGIYSDCIHEQGKTIDWAFALTKSEV